MSRPPTVLMVCLGNICRSPTAEATLRAAADARGIELEVHSAGIGAWHVGAPPDARMRRAAAERGLTLTGRAQQVDLDALRAADLVLAMDRTNLTDLEALVAATDITTPIRLFREFDPEAREGDLDVPDPYYGGPEGFATVVEMCRRTSEHLVEELGTHAGRGVGGLAPR